MQRRLGRTGQTNGNDSTADAKGRARPREDSGPLAGEGRGQPRARGWRGASCMPSRGMRVHRKRGEQLLSCQREPLNLPADLLTIVPASYHRAFAFFLRPLSSLSLFVILFLGPEYYDFVLEGFVGRSAIDVTKRWHSRFYPIPFKWNMCMKIKVKVKVCNEETCPTWKRRTSLEYLPRMAV